MHSPFLGISNEEKTCFSISCYIYKIYRQSNISILLRTKGCRYIVELIKLIQSFSSPFLDNFFELVTMMGEDMFFLLVMTLFFLVHKQGVWLQAWVCIYYK